MDNIKFYRQTIEKILRKYVEIPYPYQEIDQYLNVITKLTAKIRGLLYTVLSTEK